MGSGPIVRRNAALAMRNDGAGVYRARIEEIHTVANSRWGTSLSPFELSRHSDMQKHMRPRFHHSAGTRMRWQCRAGKEGGSDARRGSTRYL